MKTLAGKTIQLLLAVVLLLSLIGCEKDSTSYSIQIHHEAIPGSKHHGPNGTWWGYNQSKIVRKGSNVFMYVIENENLDINPNPNASNPSKIVLYGKFGDGAWTKGASLNTSRPGNILIDSQGAVHLIVFEPTYTSPDENGSYGRLVHYEFTGAQQGDLNTYNRTIIVDNDGFKDGENVNIRIGASISSDDNIAISYGLFKSVRLWHKKRGESQWIMDYCGSSLETDYYYPFVVSSTNGYFVFAVQDEWTGPSSPVQYQMNRYFEKRGAAQWTSSIIADYRAHSLATTRSQLVENTDLMEDNSGRVHLIYQTRLDPIDQWKNTFYQEIINSGTKTSNTTAGPGSNGSWMRLAEAGGEIYYLCSAWDKLYIRKGANGKYIKLDVPSVDGMYIYTSASRGGTSRNETYLDILMLCGNSTSYPNAKNYYVRILKSDLEKLD